jgi:ribonuclease-3
MLELAKKLGIKFKDIDLLKQALIHRSYLNEHPGFGLGHNERLEFLGDAVLELVVTEYLYKNYDNPEGEMTAWRASLVNTEMLSKIANKLGIGDYLMLSKGEAKDRGRGRQCILADTLEAVIGAIYLDQGYKAAQKFIEKNILNELPQIIEKGLYRDPKSRFQEEAQEKVGVTPVYKVLDEWGPDHAKEFEVGVFLENELVAKGHGFSKQEAEEEAAREALSVKGWE